MIYVLCKENQRIIFIEYINSIGKYLPLQIVSNINDIKILENDMIWIMQELDISLFESYKNQVYLINTEQNTKELNLSKLKSYPSNIKMIDYSLDNIRLYPRANYYHIPYMVNLDEVYDYPKIKDMIMIGSGNEGCPMRTNIARQLDSLVWFQNYFGPERDDQLFRHKILLNVHFNEEYKVLEEIRINRCIYNKMIVITEKGNHDYYELKDYFIECEYEDIVKVAKEVLANYDYYYKKLFANFDLIKIHSNHKRLIDEFLTKSSKNDSMLN